MTPSSSSAKNNNDDNQRSARRRTMFKSGKASRRTLVTISLIAFTTLGTIAVVSASGNDALHSLAVFFGGPHSGSFDRSPDEKLPVDKVKSAAHDGEQPEVDKEHKDRDKGTDEKEGVRVVKMPTGPETVTGPFSMTAEAFGITPPIRDMPAVRDGLEPKYDPDKVVIEDHENNEVEVDRTVPGAFAGPTKDALAARSRKASIKAPLVMPGPSLTFDGIISNNLLTTFGTTSMPPDTNGDVGPSHYVQITNFGVFRVFNKTGTALTATARISTLFSGLPANNKCRLRDNGDPVVNYDPLADRWLISQVALSDDGGEASSPYYQCIAVSQTGDPTGSWFAYAFQGPNTNFPDYPKWGVWTDGYYLSTHEFNDSGTAYVQGGFYAFNRDKMIAGDATANYVYFSNSASFGQLPADIDGYMPPAAGTPEMFFRFDADEFGGTDSLIPFEFVPNFITPASSTFTIKPSLSVAAFDPRNPAGRNDIEQPAPALATENVDALGSNLMFRVAYRNLGTIASPSNSYVMNWTVNVSGATPTTPGTHQAAIRWEELRRSGAGAMSVFDQGTHAPDPVSGTGRNRWMGSIAQDYLGNLALGFSRSGSAAGAFPDIVWAGRTGGVQGTMNEGEATMFASTGVQQTANGRWGDYSAMTVDPSDDCTFWYTTEYRDSVNNGTGTNNPFKWSTRIGNFKFPGCSAQPKGQIAVNVTSCSTAAAISGATVTVTPGGFNRLTGAGGSLVSNINAAPGTYSVTATKGLLTASQAGVVVTNGSTTTVNLCLSGTVVAATTAAVATESCLTNSSAEPGEMVTANLGLQNIAGATTTALTRPCN